MLQKCTDFPASTDHCIAISFLEPLAFRKTSAEHFRELLLHIKISFKLLKEPRALLSYTIALLMLFLCVPLCKPSSYQVILHFGVLLAPVPPAVPWLQLSLLTMWE